MSVTNKCAIPHCKNLLKLTSRVNTCQACRSSFRYWQAPGKGVAAILVRQQQLEKWTDRILFLATKERRFRRAGTAIRADQAKRIADNGHEA